MASCLPFLRISSTPRLFDRLLTWKLECDLGIGAVCFWGAWGLLAHLDLWLPRTAWCSVCTQHTPSSLPEKKGREGQGGGQRAQDGIQSVINVLLKMYKKEN